MEKKVIEAKEKNREELRLNKLFVYGTLKRGERLHSHYLKNSKYIGKASITGFELFYYIGGYPVLYKNSESKKKVRGEVFLVSDKVLNRVRSVELGVGYKEGRYKGMIFFYKENYKKVVETKFRHLLLPISEYTGKKEEAWRRKLLKRRKL